MATTEVKLERLYRQHVEYDQKEMDKNMRIATDVVNDFKTYLQEENIIVKVLQQGSAFEGIKVGRPDEFDFLLILPFGNDITPREARNVSGRDFDRTQLAGYWQLGVSGSSYEKFCSGNALSTSKYKVLFQTAINKYMRKVQDGSRSVQGIRSSDQSNASIGNPALTIQVAKAGGSKISIDMSVCIEVRTGLEPRYFIAKQHSSEKSDTFWLVMNSQKELDMFRNMSAKVKTYYRIIKFLLQQKVQNTYILKTAFLHLYVKHQDRKLSDGREFLRLMIEFLRDCFLSGDLGTYFNRPENILARYNSGDLSNRAGYFKRLCNKDSDAVVDELIGKAVPTRVVPESSQFQLQGAKVGDCVVM